MLLLPLWAMAQQANFNIKGMIGNVGKPARVYLQYISDDKEYTDSAVLTDGLFSFTGHITEDAVKARLLLSYDGSTISEVFNWYFGKETITLLSEDSLLHLQVTGSSVYADMQAYQQVKGTEPAGIYQIADQRLEAANAVQLLDSVLLVHTIIGVQHELAAYKRRLLRYAKHHQASYFSLHALASLLNDGMVGTATAGAVYRKLDVAVRTSGQGQYLFRVLNGEVPVHTKRIHELAMVFRGAQ